jgi:EpsI family protein
VASALLLAASLGAVQILERHPERYPERTPLTYFPRIIDEWTGTTGALTADAIEMLGLTDYVLARYHAPGEPQPIDLYISYHRSQKQGAMPHSPSICLPGSGWETLSLERGTLEAPSGTSIPVVRAIMQNGDQKLLVYYWFQQRGAIYSNEYLMRLALFRDSIVMNRSDGGMIRVMTPISASVSEAEDRLRAFIARLTPILPRYVPD